MLALGFLNQNSLVAQRLSAKLLVKFRKIFDKKCISIFSASLILNWEDDSDIYNDRKTKSEHNGDEKETSETRGQKVFIPTHLSPVVRTKRFIFVFLFMFVDASLTIINVSLFSNTSLSFDIHYRQKLGVLCFIL